MRTSESKGLPQTVDFQCCVEFEVPMANLPRPCQELQTCRTDSIEDFTGPGGRALGQVPGYRATRPDRGMTQGGGGNVVGLFRGGNASPYRRYCGRKPGNQSPANSGLLPPTRSGTSAGFCPSSRSERRIVALLLAKTTRSSRATITLTAMRPASRARDSCWDDVRVRLRSIQSLHLNVMKGGSMALMRNLAR